VLADHPRRCNMRRWRRIGNAEKILGLWHGDGIGNSLAAASGDSTTSHTGANQLNDGRLAIISGSAASSTEI
jgi:hypothetical protein